MDDDMRRSLLNKKSANFDKMYEDCLIKIQRVKQKNDFMQKQVGTDVEETIKNEVQKQKQFIQRQCRQLKTIMADIQKKFKDPESRNKLKTLKIDAQKQIERNKIILKDLINKSFLVRSRGSAQSDDDMDQYMQGGQVTYDPIRQNNVIRQTQDDEDKQNYHRQSESLITDNAIDIDFEIERKMLQEKKQLLDNVEQTTNTVNNIMNDMALNVDEQGENLEIISEQMMKTNKNVVETNKQLEEASKIQKKSRRKYAIFALLLIIIIVGVVGVVFITSN